MLKGFRNKTAAASVSALIAALGVGGIALAQSSGSSAGQQGQTQTASQARDSAGSGATEQGNSSEEAGSNEQSGASETSDAGNEGTAGEQQDSTTEQESGSEAPENDGPGGHADEPGNPNANHEAQGQE
jgi:hypothetical protein